MVFSNWTSKKYILSDAAAAVSKKNEMSTVAAVGEMNHSKILRISRNYWVNDATSHSYTMCKDPTCLVAIARGRSTFFLSPSINKLITMV